MKQQPKTKEPWAFAVPSLSEARALRAFSKGEATPEEQKRAFNWIIRGACRAGSDLFVPGQTDVTAYLAGRLSVSLQMGWVLNQPVEAFRKDGETDA